MRTTTLTAAAVLAAALPLAAAASDNPKSRIQNPKSPRPNILVFLADDLSLATTALSQNPDAFPTPNMRRLAAAGMTFDRAYVASPTSAPSRAALLTGLYPIRNGAMFNHQFPTLAPKTWPDYFHDLGYEVVAIGKVAHYNQITRYNFDYSAYYNYHEDICVDKAIEWLKTRQTDPARAAKPLCLMVGTNWPHVPWPAKGTDKWPTQNAETIPTPATACLLPPLLDTPETREAWTRYAAAVTNADNDLGKTYDAVLKYLGPDTLVVFSADNGAQFPFHKWNTYNGGLREPLIISWPGHIAPGTRTDALVSWIDLLPTLLEAASTSGSAKFPLGPQRSAPPPDNPQSEIRNPQSLDGLSFLPVLLGQTATHRTLIYATHSGDGDFNNYPMRALIGPRYKYIRNLAPDREYNTHIDKAPADTAYWPSWSALAQTDPAAAATVARYHHRPPEELYDLETDPYDLTNLAPDPAYATLLADYRQKLDTHMAAYNDQGLPTEQHFKDALAAADKKPAGKASTKAPAKAGGKKGGKKNNTPSAE